MIGICYEATTSSRKGLVLVALKAAATPDPSVLSWFCSQLRYSVLHAVGQAELHNILLNPCRFVS